MTMSVTFGLAWWGGWMCRKVTVVKSTYIVNFYKKINGITYSSDGAKHYTMKLTVTAVVTTFLKMIKHKLNAYTRLIGWLHFVEFPHWTISENYGYMVGLMVVIAYQTHNDVSIYKHIALRINLIKLQLHKTNAISCRIKGVKSIISSVHLL